MKQSFLNNDFKRKSYIILMSNNFIEDYELLINLCNENKIIEIQQLLLKIDLDINGNLIMSQLCKEENVVLSLVLRLLITI